MARRGLAARVTTWVLAGALNLAGIVLVLGWAFAKGEPTLGDGSVSARVRDLLWFALLCGLSAFATIEILKRVLGLRGYYQRFQTRRWLADRSRAKGDAAFEELLAAMGLSDEASAAVSLSEDASGERESRLQRLLELSEEYRVFNLPTEQLAAQISAAAEVALASEGRQYVCFLAGLTGLSPLAIRAAFDKELLEELKETEELPEPARRTAEQGAFGVSQRVRTGIDQLQISLGERWRRFLQSAALWIAGFYGLLLVREPLPVVVQGRPLQRTSESLFILAAFVVGGLLAWILRDLAAALERIRR